MTAPSRLDLVTTWGVIRVSAANGELTRCVLPMQADGNGKAFRILANKLSAQTRLDRLALQCARQFLRACLAGKATPPSPRLSLADHTDFSRRVLAALQRIPRGTTLTYGEIAKRIGAARAARAVGTACGANTLPLFIPCHRVVAAGGKLGGFSAGLAWKKMLLAKERAT